MIRVEGELAAFQFRSPHSQIHVDVTDEGGTVVPYTIEWGAPTVLGRQGIERSTLMPGDHVIVNGTPVRGSGRHRVLLRTIERPSDAFRWGFEKDETFH